MLISKQIVWHVKRKTMRNIYIDTFELKDLLINLTSGELTLFNHIMGLAVTNPPVEAFDTTILAKDLNCSVGTIKQSRAALVKKGYLIIRKFKDESKDTMVRVVIGKDQVDLYNLGLKVEIKDAKAYRELIKQFPFTNTALSPTDRSALVKQANEWYLKNYQ